MGFMVPNVTIPVTVPGTNPQFSDSTPGNDFNFQEWLNANQTLQWEREQQAAASAQEFAQRSASEAMSFEATEAATAREWSKMMSDTAYQRGVADLQAAGLNPILAANSAASVGQASSASGKAAQASKAVAPSARDFAAQFKDIAGSLSKIIKLFV